MPELIDHQQESSAARFAGLTGLQFGLNAVEQCHCLLQVAIGLKVAREGGERLKPGAAFEVEKKQFESIELQQRTEQVIEQNCFTSSRWANQDRMGTITLQLTLNDLVVIEAKNEVSQI
jgi:hypothetical protein